MSELHGCQHLDNCVECRKRLGKAWGAFLSLMMDVKTPWVTIDNEGREVYGETSLLEQAFHASPELRKRFRKALKV